jgi:hypothetical protein
MNSASLPKATQLPKKVTAPIRPVTDVATLVCMSAAAPPAWWAACTATSEAMPTSTEAAPPKPLNSPTISGMEVILTFSAATQPTSVPSTMPPRM